MERLVWRYIDDAGAIIENVYKFCMEEKKSDMKLTLNRVWDRNAALTGVSRSAAQKIVEEKKMHRTSSSSQINHRHLPRKCHWMTLTSWMTLTRTIASMYSLEKVLPTLDNITTDLKQSIGFTGSKGRLRKDVLHTNSAYTRCGMNQKVLMGYRFK